MNNDFIVYCDFHFRQSNNSKMILTLEDTQLVLYHDCKIDEFYFIKIEDK